MKRVKSLRCVSVKGEWEWPWSQRESDAGKVDEGDRTLAAWEAKELGLRAVESDGSSAEGEVEELKRVHLGPTSLATDGDGQRLGSVRPGLHGQHSSF